MPIKFMRRIIVKMVLGTSRFDTFSLFSLLITSPMFTKRLFKNCKFYVSDFVSIVPYFMGPAIDLLEGRVRGRGPAYPGPIQDKQKGTIDTKSDAKFCNFQNGFLLGMVT